MKIRVERDASVREVLEESFPETSKTHIRKMLRYGCVSVDGAVVRHPQFMLRAGWEVEIKKYKDREGRQQKAPFKILYEDDILMAVYKPAGILSSGRTTERVRSMFGMVNQYVTQSSRGKLRAYTVHRLDREVSGILLFAKTEEAKFFLQEHWTEVDKRYFALVHGIPPERQGTLQSWLKENARQVVYSLENEVPGAKWAVTRYRWLDSYTWEGRKVDVPGEPASARPGRKASPAVPLRSLSDADLFSLLEIKLETGRKNQIRVHLADMGCSIVGDRKYGGGQDDKVKRTIRLLACSISFPHPVQQRRVHVETRMPDGFVWIGQTHEY